MPIIPFHLLTRLYRSGHFLKYFIFVAAKHESCKPFSRPPLHLEPYGCLFVFCFCTTCTASWTLPCCREATSRRAKTHGAFSQQPFGQEIRRKKQSKLGYFTSRFCSILVKQSQDATPVPVGLRSVI